MIFYDTSSLLKETEGLFDKPFIISSITLNELERIKTAYSKDNDIKFAARRLLHLLDENHEKYEVRIFTKDMLEPFEERGLEITDDIRILATAYSMKDEVEFYTNDLALKHIARLFFEKVYSVQEAEDNYTGYAEIVMTDEEMDRFYSNPTLNEYGLNINEYINIYNIKNELVDTRAWDGTCFSPLTFGEFKSKWFGKIKPYKGDVYQAMACDSFLNNKITMVKGPAGTGKSILSLGYLLHLLEKGKIDKIIVFCNTVATKGAARLGYYPGTRDEKLLNSQIGTMLSSKIGDTIEVERMIEEGELVLLPFADIRGFDTSGMNAGIYITEAQNLDITLMKLALQRIGEDCICIIDGDDRSQVDDDAFAGSRNGMRRVSKVFRNSDIYGEVELKTIHRSKIAQLAEFM